MHIIYNMNAYS